MNKLKRKIKGMIALYKKYTFRDKNECRLSLGLEIEVQIPLAFCV